jgi:limonene-1,2-epoxide hydrolase
MSGAMLDRFQDLYRELDGEKLHLLAEVYAPDVVFIDPIHRVEGLSALTAYFRRLYAGVADISFDFGEVLAEDDRAFLSWTMRMTHTRFRPGQTLVLPGATFIRFKKRVRFHRDYFDLGAMVYERVPLLGQAVKAIKNRL